MDATIYTIGHSTHSMQEFLDMLHSFGILTLVDIRSLPGSRKFPHFDKEILSAALAENAINYIHMTGLGGRRKAKKDSKNTRWNNISFRGYADYMETTEFHAAVEQLKAVASERPTAFMCSEAVWWRCHRSMVSDFLMAQQWRVVHIMATGKSQDHKYTAPAIVEDGKVFYSDPT